MKEIRSFFEEPSNYLFGFILGIGSFSGLMFWFIENGLSFKEPSWVFYGFIGFFFGIPALLPFYHLILSGRNRPREFSIFLVALFVVLITLFSGNFHVSLIAFLVWVLLFAIMLKLGKSLRLSSDDTIWIRENAIMEILLIILILIFVLGFALYSSKQYLVRDPNVKEAFDLFSRGVQLRSFIDYRSDSIGLERKVYRDGDTKESMDNDFIEMSGQLGSDSIITANTQTGNYVLEPIQFKKVQQEIRLTGMLFHRTQNIFATKFFVVLRHFQLKGLIFLLAASFMLLVVWVICIEKDEVANRVRAHFFILLLLIVPVLRKFELKDITIEKPFGFSFSDGKTADRRIEVMLDSIARRQIYLGSRMDSVQHQVGQVENQVFERVNNVLVDTNYIHLVDAVTQDMSSGTRDLYLQHLETSTKKPK